MTMATKRLRIFAGPNGSGKSTIFDVVDKKIGCKYFVNADDIQHKLAIGGLTFNDYEIHVDKESFVKTLRESSFFDKLQDADSIIQALEIKENCLYIPKQYANGYISAFIAEYIRQNMLGVVPQFTIETVLSDSRKIEYIKQAKSLGYRIYLYFISTKDVEINIKRVYQRVCSGGHDVPEEKIRKRYTKSLENVFDVLSLCDRAYFFDNSEEMWQLLAEYENRTLTPKQEQMPNWFFQYVLSKMK